MQIELTLPSEVTSTGTNRLEKKSGGKRKSNYLGFEQVELISDCVQNDGNIFREYQEFRDFITTSPVKDLEYQKEELARFDKEIEKILLSVDYKLIIY